MDLFAIALKLKSDAQKMIADLRGIDAAGKKAGATLDQTTAAVKKQDAAMRQLIESGEFYKDTLRASYTAELKRQGLWERFIVIEKQVKDEINAVTQAQLAQSAATTTATKATSGAAQGIGTLKSSIVQLASQITGLNPAVGRASTVLAGLGGSATATVGALAAVAGGATALAVVFSPAITAWNNAKKASDDLISSLAAQGKALRENGDAATENALKFARANLAKVQASQLPVPPWMRAASSLTDPSSFTAFISTGLATNKAVELQKALDAVAAAEKAVADGADDMREKRMAADRAMAEFKTGAAEIFKRIDEDDKRRREEEQRRFDQRIKLLSQAVIFDDLRAKAANELGKLESFLTRAIDSGNISLERRIDLEEKLAVVRQAAADAARIDAMLARPTGPTVGITPMGEGGFQGLGTPKPLPERIIPQLPPLINQSGKVAVDAMMKLQDTMMSAVDTLALSLADGIYNAFKNAFSGKGIGGFIEGFGKTVIAGLGTVFTMIGQQVILGSTIMLAIKKALQTWNPAISLAAGIALVALGGAIGGAVGGAAQRGFAQVGGYGGGSTQEITRLQFVNRPGYADKLAPVQPISMTFIGANDPKLQREFKNVIEKANRR